MHLLHSIASHRCPPQPTVKLLSVFDSKMVFHANLTCFSHYTTPPPQPLPSLFRLISLRLVFTSLHSQTFSLICLYPSPPPSLLLSFSLSLSPSPAPRRPQWFCSLLTRLPPSPQVCSLPPPLPPHPPPHALFLTLLRWILPHNSA